MNTQIKFTTAAEAVKVIKSKASSSSTRSSWAGTCAK